MHNAAFAALGLDYVYVALRVAPADLRRALAGVRALGIWGLNVTVPHKEKILPLLDDLTPRAREIGAVNTVFRRGEALVGDNTDAGGFRAALTRLGVPVRRKRVLLLGAGGSARAVVWTLVRGGARSLTVRNRSAGRARALARFARSLGPIEVETAPLEGADPTVLEAIDLVVNCTSLGLDGRSRPPLELDRLRASAAVYDLVYGRSGTPLVAAAIRSGLRAADGTEMLVGQAADAFRAWTGRAAPVATMREAFAAGL